MKLEYEDCYNVYCRDVIDVVGGETGGGRGGVGRSSMPRHPPPAAPPLKGLWEPMLKTAKNRPPGSKYGKTGNLAFLSPITAFPLII